jgi:hypothetical protein
MPKIPTYERKLSIPGETGQTLIDPGKASMVENANANLGRQVGKEAEGITNIIQIHKEKLRQQDIANKALTISAQYNEDQRIFKQSEDQNTGETAYGNMERGTKFREDSLSKYTKGITDPELKMKIEGHIRAKSESLFDHLATHQATQRQEVTKQAIVGIKTGLLKDVYEGEDIEDAVEELRNAVKNQYQTGARGELSSVDEITKGEAAIAEAHLDGLINRSPSAGIEAIKSGKYKQYLPQKKIEEYDKKAKDLQKALIQDAKTVKKEAEQAEKDKLKTDREATGNEFVSRLVSGKLTRADILKSNLEPTGENGKQYWLNQIEAMEKKISGGGEGFKTDKALDGKLFARIVKDPESITEGQIVDYIGKGLSRSSADSLITERRQRLKGDKDPARDAAEKAVIENLKRDRRAGVFGEDKSGDLEYAKQIDSFRRWSKAHPDDDPSDYYEKLIEPVKRSFVFDFLAKDKPDPKAKREAMEKAGEIPGRKGSKKPDPLGIR